MPKVAQYGGPKATTQVASQPRKSNAGNEAIGRANQQLIKSAANVAQEGAKMVQRIDTTAAEEALVAFERDKNDLFFNPEKGYFNTQGKNAFDAAGTTSDAMGELQKKHGESLGPNAKSMFDKASGVQITRSQTDIAKHSSTGLKAWEVATINAQVENTVENASLYWNQPDKLAVQNALGRQAVIDSAKMEGIGAEATNEKLQTYDSAFTKTAITSAIGHSAQSGKDMMEKQGGKLEGPDRVKLESAIDAKFKAEKIQRDSQSAISTGTKLVSTYETRAEILDEVNKIRDPELRKKTSSEAMRQFNLREKANDEAQATSYEAAESHIVDGGSAETFQSEDPEGWERLSAKQKKSISTGKSVITDWNEYSDLMTLPKAQLAKINPTEYFHKLAPTERGKLVSAVKSANGSGSSADKIDHQIGRTRGAQTSAALEQILGKKTKWNDDKRVQANSFYDLLDGEVGYREQQKGSALSSAEYTDVLSDLTREVTIERSTFGVDFLAPDVEQDVTDIPPENVRVLSNFLRDNNIPVTADNLLRAQRQAE